MNMQKLVFDVALCFLVITLLQSFMTVGFGLAMLIGFVIPFTTNGLFK